MILAISNNLKKKKNDMRLNLLFIEWLHLPSVVSRRTHFMIMNTLLKLIVYISIQGSIGMRSDHIEFHFQCKYKQSCDDDCVCAHAQAKKKKKKSVPLFDFCLSIEDSINYIDIHNDDYDWEWRDHPDMDI